MSYLGTISEFIQHFCSEDTEINNLTKEFVEFNQENSQFENQLEEIDREHVRHKIELYHLESITSHNDKNASEHFTQTSMKVYKEIIELNSLIEKLDFTKILQCHHMEMEAKFLKEWQPIQDCFVKTLKRHDEMEQRHIVKKYRQAEVAHREAEESEKKELDVLKISRKKSRENLDQAKEKLNKLIVYLISANKDIESLTQKIFKLKQHEAYIEELRQERLNLTKQLEQTQLKAFNPNLSSYSSRNVPSKSSQNIEAVKCIMPSLPSFTEILNSFHQIEKKNNITTIENTTNICVKSILRNSSNNQTITTKKTKNVRFKLQLEEYQEDITQTVFNTDTETDSDLNIHVSEPPTVMEVNECNEDQKENLQEMKDLENNNEIETIDLLTPADKLMGDEKENLEEMDTSEYVSYAKNKLDEKKPLIEIQECIVFKTPFAIQSGSKAHDKENFLNVTASSSKHSADNSLSSSTYPSSNVNIKDILNTTKISFYEQLSNVSTSAEVSPNIISNSYNKISALKGFETFFNDNKEYRFGSKDSNEEDKLKETPTNNIHNEVQDFLDFGSSKGFTFDSDDNMTDNVGNMDFM